MIENATQIPSFASSAAAAFRALVEAAAGLLRAQGLDVTPDQIQAALSPPVRVERPLGASLAGAITHLGDGLHELAAAVREQTLGQARQQAQAKPAAAKRPARRPTTTRPKPTTPTAKARPTPAAKPKVAPSAAAAK